MRQIETLCVFGLQNLILIFDFLREASDAIIISVFHVFAHGGGRSCLNYTRALLTMAKIFMKEKA